MATTPKIYAITNNKTQDTRLVQTSNRHQALAHVAKSDFTVELADQFMLVALVSKGVKVETPLA